MSQYHGICSNKMENVYKQSDTFQIVGQKDDVYNFEYITAWPEHKFHTLETKVQYQDSLC